MYRSEYANGSAESFKELYELHDRIRELEKDLDTANKGVGWISVEEGLPNESTIPKDRVIVALDGTRNSNVLIDTDRIVNGKWVRWHGSVTHWMEPPLLPREE